MRARTVRGGLKRTVHAHFVLVLVANDAAVFEGQNELPLVVLLVQLARAAAEASRPLLSAL